MSYFNQYLLYLLSLQKKNNNNEHYSQNSMFSKLLVFHNYVTHD